MELIILTAGLNLLFLCMGYKMGKGEKIIELPRKVKASVKTEAQQAELEKKLMEEKVVRRIANG